jgi:hypothetical protein
MRPLIFAAPALLLVLSACASGPGTSRYGEDLRKLTADCEARSGVIVPTGASTGRPETEYACQISGGATRLPGN